MRISDWSSDVVSSDLLKGLAAEPPDAGIADMEQMRGGRLDDHGAERADIAAVAIVRIAAAPRLGMPTGIGGGQHALRRGLQRPGVRRGLGRGTGRESVCHDVWI